jgi:hypothetical protein
MAYLSNKRVRLNRFDQAMPLKSGAFFLIIALGFALIGCSHDFGKFHTTDDDGSAGEQASGGSGGNSTIKKDGSIQATTQGCGDGVRVGLEECDGEDLGAKDCVSMGFTLGLLRCTPDCKYDTTLCFKNLPVDNPLNDDIKQQCRLSTQVSFSDNIQCKSCVCETCPKPALNCGTDCVKLISCMMRSCLENEAPILCARDKCMEFIGGLTGAISLIQTDCVQGCLSQCKASVQQHDCNGTYTITDPKSAEVLSQCTSITGNLTINSVGMTDLTGVPSLKNISEIHGNLIIEDSPDGSILKSLKGLDGLKSVSGDFQITNNSTLSSLDLGSLQSVGGNLMIATNSSLQKLNLSSLTTVTGTLAIITNKVLLQLSDLSNLQTVGVLKVDTNPKLSAIGLMNLHSVSDVAFTNNPALSSCDAQNFVTRIGNVGQFSICKNSTDTARCTTQNCQ